MPLENSNGAEGSYKNKDPIFSTAHQLNSGKDNDKVTIITIVYLLRALRKTIFGLAFLIESEGRSATKGWAEPGNQRMMLSTH